MTETVRLIMEAEVDRLFAAGSTDHADRPVQLDTWREYFNERLPERAEPWWIHRKTAGDRATATLLVSHDLPCFTGHFPGAPILPGIVQVQWAQAFAADSFDNTAQASFCGLARIKFTAPVRPGAVLRLTLQKRGSTVDFRYTATDGARTSGRIRFGSTS